MLGEAFYNYFGQGHKLKCSDIDVNESWLSYLDFRDYNSYKKDVNEFEPDWLFHLGAYTDLEYCELHEEETYTTNTESVKHAVKIANGLNIPILYISTAGIFDGKKDVYDESDQPKPISHYAKSKYLGEKYVVENANYFLVCRAGWMMGGGLNKDKKFVCKIIKQIKAGKKELFIVNDKFGTPTYTYDFAKNVKVLIENKYWGLYNMACEGLTSRKEVANEILNVLNLNGKIKVNEVSSEFFKKEYFAPRPFSERLVNKKLSMRNVNHMRDWRIALNEYITSSFL